MIDHPLSFSQTRVARHALGLVDGCKHSYRNYFVTGPGSPDYEDWLAMTAAGYAKRFKSELFGGDDLFRLTRAGAEAALFPGETLDEKEFPDGL